jgi:hypothetical protein
MRPALITSGIIHFVILLLIIFGLPMLPQKKLDLPEPIAVTMVAPPSDMARTTKVDNPTPKPDVTPVQETAPEPPKPPPPPAPTPPEPPAEKLPELKPLEQQIAPVPTPEALPELAKPMQIIKPQPVAPPKPVTPPPQPPKKVQADQQQFDALLANLAPPVPKTDNQSKDKTAPKQASNAPAQRSQMSDRLTADELGRVREQLKGCWNVPIGAMNAEDLSIDVVGEFNPDRTLRAATIVDTNDRYDKDPYYRAAADSAIRALKNPRCNPLDLPANKYDEWRSMQIHFDPKEMLSP